MIRKQTRLWTTREGQRLRVCDMDDKHLANAIRMCRRVAETERRRFCCWSPGFTSDESMASFFHERDQDRALEMHTDEWAEEVYGEVFDSLLLEAERRGLDAAREGVGA